MTTEELRELARNVCQKWRTGCVGLFGSHPDSLEQLIYSALLKVEQGHSEEDIRQGKEWAWNAGFVAHAKCMEDSGNRRIHATNPYAITPSKEGTEGED